MSSAQAPEILISGERQIYINLAEGICRIKCQALKIKDISLLSQRLI